MVNKGLLLMEKTKTCTKCNNEYPATTEYFHKYKQGVYGLHSQCKTCRLKNQKEYREKHSRLGNTHQYYIENRVRHLIQRLKERGYTDLTEAQLELITKNFQGVNGKNICPYCNREIENISMLHYDHLIAYSEGGSNIVTNLIPTCKYCNRSKLNEDFSLWYREQFFYNEKREKEIMSYFINRRLERFYPKDYKGKKLSI